MFSFISRSTLRFRIASPKRDIAFLCNQIRKFIHEIDEVAILGNKIGLTLEARQLQHRHPLWKPQLHLQRFAITRLATLPSPFHEATAMIRRSFRCFRPMPSWHPSFPRAFLAQFLYVFAENSAIEFFLQKFSIRVRHRKVEPHPLVR